MRGPNAQKTNRARRLRRDSTDAERKLWHRLRARTLAGFKFVRQEAIGPYVADFVCRECRLIVEVDGGQHATDPSDVARDSFLRHQGCRVLRFWNNDVIGNMAGVLETIATSLQEATAPHPPASADAPAGRPRIKSGAGSLPAGGER